jgi:integrase
VSERPSPVDRLANPDAVLSRGDLPELGYTSSETSKPSIERTAITRACTAAGVPVFSPHDLRHRRISLLHLGGVPWARIGEHVGQRNLAVTANTYSHVLADERELDYEELVRAPA